MRKLAYLLPVLLVVAAGYFILWPEALQSRETPRKVHRLALQVNSDEPGVMNLALNNASNVEQYYKSRGEPVEVEIVAFGPGLHMLRDDTSPVKERLHKMVQAGSSIAFKACGNTRENMRRSEQRDIPLVSQAALVDSGVVRLMELQEQGWTYVRP